MNRYFEILGLSTTASTVDIKQAYRKLAKKYHPDVSSFPDAEERFIEINEAYEYLLALKAGKVVGNTQQNSSVTKDENQKRHRDPAYRWDNEQAREARERARQYAKMKYEQYKLTDAYKWSNSVYIAFQVSYTFLPLGIVLFTGIITAYYKDFLSGLVAVLGTSPLLFVTWLGYGKVKDENILEAFSLVFYYGRTYKYISLIFTAIFFLAFTIDSFFQPTYLLVFYVLVGATAMFVKSKVDTDFLTPRFIWLGLCPFVINLFFFLNAFFSSNSRIETYAFKYENNNGISLQDGIYDDKPWIRYFFDARSMDGNTIDFLIREGFFGIDVLEDYTFYWEYGRNNR